MLTAQGTRIDVLWRCSRACDGRGFHVGLTTEQQMLSCMAAMLALGTGSNAVCCELAMCRLAEAPWWHTSLRAYACRCLWSSAHG